MVAKDPLTPLRYLPVFQSIQPGFILLPTALVEGEKAAQYVWFADYILLIYNTCNSLLALWYSLRRALHVPPGKGDGKGLGKLYVFLCVFRD